MLKLYIADVTDVNIDESTLNSFPKARIEKINKLKKQSDKILSYGAGVLINKYVLKGDKSTYYTGENGKPYSTTGDFFSVSHSGNYIALAVSDKEVGCDIQISNEREYLKIAKFVFHKNEIELLNSTDDKKATFFEIWTKKEAFLKLLGTGFQRKATDIDLSQDIYKENDKNYFFANWKKDEYFISVCYEESNEEAEYSIVTLK